MHLPPYNLVLLALLILAQFLPLSQCAIQSDEIHALPGWSGPLFSKTYQGHMEIPQGKFFNYFFFEAQNSPETAPVMLWMQGGPGASGFLGLFTELGPYKADQNSIKNNQDVPTLQPNPHTWNKDANYLFFESPPFVGFSYCSEDCPHYDDVLAAADNYLFLQAFFEHFPEFKDNDFWLTGESYAGIYIPTLAHEILTHTNDINLKGVMVGNGCNGIETIGGCGIYRQFNNIDFLHRLGQVSTISYEAFKKLCTPSNFYDEPKCSELYSTLSDEAGHYYYLHIYDECFWIEDEFNKSGMDLNTFLKSHPTHTYDYPCFQEYAITQWANHPEVLKFFGSPNPGDGWEEIAENNYTRTENDVFPYYQEMMDKNIKIMIYFGDLDIDVPFNGGQQWIESLGLKKTKDWTPWTLDGGSQVAGYYMVFEDKMTYLTVRGAGHLVPQNKPIQAYEMFYRFTQNQPFLGYNE